MWSYFGSKKYIINFYPAPKHDKIIEPFAGTAAYSIKYFDRDILLIDKYEVIIKIWQWLQKCSPQDILKLPRMKEGETLNKYHFDCEEAKMLMGFLIAKCVESPRNKASSWTTTERPNHINHYLKLISSSLFKIKHWKIKLGSYENIPNQKATWFIDPPYQKNGIAYKHGSKDIDYNFLGNWCRSREGQVIVCENNEANWLPFKPMKKHWLKKGYSIEVIWSNEKTEYDNIQQKLAL